MKCDEAGEWFGIYWDLPEDSPERLAVDLHVRSCPTCAEEFRMWEESAAIIQELPEDDRLFEEPATAQIMNENVMNRIYSEQSWFLPPVRRTYAFSYGFKRKIAALLAGLLAVFVSGFLYTTIGNADRSGHDFSGVMDTANAFAASHSFGDNMHLEVPVAGLSDPIMLNVSPAMPQYWIALSMLGIVMTLLILNWLSRVRA
ncbi:anti-sigma factor family protein [Cohnella yongneupensis]|uniref:Anti-sigma factor family protein n=1 Tax=Cohnella yongneupensis TaxID=425006 RepID=A0ABW0R7C1_9BACL